MKFNLYLTGYVGGWDFDADSICRYLHYAQDQHLEVCIESIGGSLNSGLRIMAGFGRHGDVAVHLTGANASAATLAAMGASRVTIDENASFLIHKVSTEISAFANADNIEEIIKALEEAKEDLDKSDAFIAAIYARRCKKSSEELLALMANERWLTAQEALEWGFVDEVTSYADDASELQNQAMIKAVAEAGLPELPNIQAVANQPVSTSSEPVEQHTAEPDTKNAGSIIAEFRNFASRLYARFFADKQPEPEQSATVAQPQNVAQSPEPTPEPEPNPEPEPTPEPQPAKRVMVASRQSNGNSSLGEFVNVSRSARDLYNSLP